MPSNNKNQLFDINFILNKIDIKEGQKVADLGCGNFNYFVLPLAKLISDKGVVYAVDIIKGIIEDGKKIAWEANLKQVKPIWGNLEVFKGIKIDSASLDRALLVNVLNQSEKRGDILKEAVRLLKIGGRLLIIDWKLTAAPFGPEPHRRLDPEKIKELAPKISLDLLTEFEAGPFHYGLIFNKL